MNQQQANIDPRRRSTGGNLPPPPNLTIPAGGKAGIPSITPTNQSQATATGGLISLTDALELVKAAIGGNQSVRTPEIKNVPKLKNDSLEDVILWVESVAYMVQARIGSAEPILNPNFDRYLPCDGKKGFDQRVAAGTATADEKTAMMRNEFAAGCLLSGACDVKNVVAGLQDDWDEVNWPMGQVPRMLNRL